MKNQWNREKSEYNTESLGNGFKPDLLELTQIEALNLEATNLETQSARHVNIPAGLHLLCLRCQLDKQEPVVVI